MYTPSTARSFIKQTIDKDLALYVIGSNIIDGNMAIGSAVPPRQMLDVTGNAIVSGKIGIGGVTYPSIALEVMGTDAILVPAGNTSDRPSGRYGLIRYNIDEVVFEGYSDRWKPIGMGRFDGSGVWRVSSVYPATDSITMGRIGIGTDAPTYAFDVYGESRFNSNVFIESNIRVTSNIHVSNNVDIDNFLTAKKIGINTVVAPTISLEVVGTDAILIPKGKTTDRPLVDKTGMIRYNIDDEWFEGFYHDEWRPFGIDLRRTLRFGMNNGISTGVDAGINNQQASAIAIGTAAAQDNQGTHAVAIGEMAGNTSQGQQAIAIGEMAGNTSQGQRAVAIGEMAGHLNQGVDAIAIGNSKTEVYVHNFQESAYTNTTVNEVGILTTATRNNNQLLLGDQGEGAIAIGKNAGFHKQSVHAVSIGSLAGRYLQGENAVAIGRFAGYDMQNHNTVAVGIHAGTYNQGASAVALGRFAGVDNQGASAVAIGEFAGFSQQSEHAIAIGTNAGQMLQGTHSIAIGNRAGENSQASRSIILNASGTALTTDETDTCCIKPIKAKPGGGSILVYNPTSGEVTSVILTDALLLPSGTYAQRPQPGGSLVTGLIRYNTESKSFEGYSDNVWVQISNSVRIGENKGIGVGVDAGITTQGSSAVAIGEMAGKITQGDDAVAIGNSKDEPFVPNLDDVEYANIDSEAVLVINRALDISYNNIAMTDNQYSRQGKRAISVGINAGAYLQSAHAVAVGPFSGKYLQQNNAVAIGRFAGHHHQERNSVAVGCYSGSYNQGTSAIAVGRFAGIDTQGTSAIAVGDFAGFLDQGQYSIAIGKNAGKDTQAKNSIILNATGELLNNNTISDRDSCFIKPIKSKQSIGAILMYDRTSGEVTSLTNTSALLVPKGGYIDRPPPDLTVSGLIRYNTDTNSFEGYSLNAWSPIGSSSSSSTGGGTTTTTNSALRIGTNKGISIGSEAGIQSQGSFAIAFGDMAGQGNQGAYAIAVGMLAGQKYQGVDAISIGNAKDDIFMRNFESSMIDDVTPDDANIINFALDVDDTVITINDYSYQGTRAVSVGMNAGGYRQSPHAVAVGPASGKYIQSDNAIAVGRFAGYQTQGKNSVAVGALAGSSNQGESTVAIGRFAGVTTQGTTAVAVGEFAGFSQQGIHAVAIGKNSGKISQGTHSIAIGNFAGETSQAPKSIILNATDESLNNHTDDDTEACFIKPIKAKPSTGSILIYNTVSGEVTSATQTAALLLPNGTDDERPIEDFLMNGLIRYNTTTNIFEGYSENAWSEIGGSGGGGGDVRIGTLTNAIGIGKDAGQTNQGASSIAIGNEAGSNTQGEGGIAIGVSAGGILQNLYAVAMGGYCGRTNQGIASIAIGYAAAFENQAESAVAIGMFAGETNQGSNAIAIGKYAGKTLQSDNGISIGNCEEYIYIINNADNTYTHTALEDFGIINTALNIILPTETVFDVNQQPIEQPPNPAAFIEAYGYQGRGAVSIGLNAGTYRQSTHCVAVGALSGKYLQGSNAIAIGLFAGHREQHLNTVAVGALAGSSNQGDHSVAVGCFAGIENQGESSISLGQFAGFSHQGNHAVAIGPNAGKTSQGNHAVAIGNRAGETAQAPHSIIINATDIALNNTDIGTCFIKPIKAKTSAGSVLMYDTESGEVTSATPTEALLLPRGTDAERPNPSTATNGLIRYNTTSESFEGYSGGVWAAIGGGGGGGGWESSIVNVADNYTMGNVGIGTTTPTYGLHVYKNVALGSGLVENDNFYEGGPYFKQIKWSANNATSHTILSSEYCITSLCSGTIHLQLNSFAMYGIVGSINISFVKPFPGSTDLYTVSKHISPSSATVTASVDNDNNIIITTSVSCKICGTVIGGCARII